MESNSKRKFRSVGRAITFLFCLVLAAAACSPRREAGIVEQDLVASEPMAETEPTASLEEYVKRERMLLWPSDVKSETIAELPESEREIAPGVTLRIQGEVTQPTHGALQVIKVEKQSMTKDGFVSMLEWLQPETDWSYSETVEPVRTDATCKVNGTDYSASYYTNSGDKTSGFYYSADSGMIPREGNLMNDQELMDDWGALLEMEIPVDKEWALAQAEAALKQLGVTDMRLQAAERACQFTNNDIENPITKGWDFVFVPSLGGLPVYYRNGATGYNDSIYPTVMNPCISIYVTQLGVEMVDWRYVYKRTEVLQEDVAILSYESVLDVAIERLTKHHETWNGNDLTLTIIGMQLAAGIIGDDMVSDGEAFSLHPTQGRLVPVWEVIYTTEEAGSEWYNYTMVLPFCALDGGAMMVQQ